VEKLPELARGHDLKSVNATELQQRRIARHEEVGNGACRACFRRQLYAEAATPVATAAMRSASLNGDFRERALSVRKWPGARSARPSTTINSAELQKVAA
jgi:hypothetical protein